MVLSEYPARARMYHRTADRRRPAVLDRLRARRSPARPSGSTPRWSGSGGQPTHAPRRRV